MINCGVNAGELPRLFAGPGTGRMARPPHPAGYVRPVAPLDEVRVEPRHGFTHWRSFLGDPARYLRHL